MKTKKQKFACLGQLTSFFLLFLLTFALSLTSATAQDDPTTTSELQPASKVSGSGGGGGLNVSKYNGSVSYTYPISSQSIGGHSLNVSLNYCGSVSHRSFKYYDDALDLWDTKDKVSPEWLLSVNGFAVQTLSTALQFYSQDKQSNSYKNTRWMVEGYDYCNGMHNSGGSMPDIIKLLRGDGGVLELRNIYRGNNTAYNDTLKRTGRYISNSINDKSYGYVCFDTTVIPSYIRPYVPFDNARILHYYPGDGLEYIFREHLAPYGIHGHSPLTYGAGSASPMIFYLEEIRSAEQIISKFTYSRHYPTETNRDSTLNRAMISEFQGHRISINDAFMSIEALGRTYKVRYYSTWAADEVPNANADSALFPAGMVGSMGSKNGLRQNNFIKDTVNLSQSSTGFVTDIYDPLDRKTEFDYTFSRKTYMSTYKMCIGRLTKISDMSGYTTIDYHTGNGVVDSVSYAKKKLIYDFHTMAGKVSSYNKNNTLLTSSTYLFDNNPSSYNRKVTVINYDSIAVLRDTSEYFYSYADVEPHLIYNDSTGEALAWTPLEKAIRYSPLGKTTSVTTYSGDSITGTRFMYVPIERKVSFKPTLSSVGTVITHRKMEYQFTNLHDFGVDSTFGALMAKGVSRQKTIQFYPHSDTASVLDTLLTSVTEYDHLQETTGSITRTDTVWDYKQSRFVTDGLRAQGIDTTALIYQTNTITSATVIAPPIWGLLTRSFVLKSGDTLGGVMNSYQTNLVSTAPRGSLVSDTLLGGNGERQLGSHVTFKGGWYRNFPMAVTNINGSKSEMLFDYSAAPSGTMITTDTQYLSRKLFNIRNEFEMPVGGRSIVRKPALLGSMTSDTLLGFAEYGYYGSAIGSIDASGYYSASEYDNAGRATIGWQSFDFPPLWDTKPDRMRLYDTKTIRTERPDSHYCANNSWGFGSWVPGATEQTKLYCFTGNTYLADVCRDSSIQTGKSMVEKGVITYTAHSDDRLHNGTPVAGVSLSMFITIFDMMYDPDGGWSPQAVRLSIPRLGFSETYAFGVMDSVTSPHMRGMTDFTIDLPSDVVDSLVAMSNGDTVNILMESLTEGQEFEIATLSDDIAPAFVVSGSSSNPKEQDFTAQIIYNDSTLSTTAYGKIDDEYRNSNTNFSTSAVAKYGRYVRGTSEYDPIFNSSRSVDFIGNPYSPTRLDTVKSTMTGSGIGLTSTDHEGRTVSAKHDFAKSKDTIYNTDNTFTVISKFVGTPSSFGITDQNFYGLCKTVFGKDERGIVSAQYSDAFGRVRRSVTDVTGLALAVRYEYDLMGKISYVISPRGDTTKYWYDNWGNVRAVYQPDIGTTSYAYDKTGQVRFIQTDRQAGENKLSYIEYDDFGRVTLTGEAKLDSVIVAPLQTYISVYPPATPTPRMTDAIGGDTLHITTSTPPSVTVNTSLYEDPTGNPPATLPVDADTTFCLPFPQTHLQYEIGTIASPYLKRAANYWIAANAPACNRRTFENVSTYPENVLQASTFDALPEHSGSVWAGFPANDLWDSLAPTGIIRHLKGRTAAVAYRQNNAQPFHYQVYSYDERGRVEALLRFTENLGFEAVYYTYNSANMPILVRTADPFNQHSVWYSYDDNGRIDTVYSSLLENQGLGWAAAKRPAMPLKPLNPDTWISYARRGYADTVFYATDAGIAKTISHLDIRGRLDTMKAKVAGTDVFVQNMGYDASNNVTRRTEGGTSTFLTYDNAARLTKEVKGIDTTTYLLDNVSKRLSRKQGIVKDTLLYSGNKLTAHRKAIDTITYTRDSEGAVTGMNTKTAGTPFVQREVLEYDAAGLTTRYKVNSNNPTGSGCDVPPITAVFDSTKDWRYRHGPSGLREQRRLYYSPQGDSCQCIHEWTYYLRGAGDEVRAVWSGRQNADRDNCDNTITRRVVFYPMEYMGAGGANYVRDNSGNWVKEFRITDYLGSVRTAIQSTAGATLNYTPYGKPSNTTDRWSYLGQEKDRETIGLSEFDYRKYQSETGSFLRPDPLALLSPGVSSFVYGNASPLVFSDPSGLFGETAIPEDLDGDGLPDTGGGCDVVTGIPGFLPNQGPEPKCLPDVTAATGDPIIKATTTKTIVTETTFTPSQAERDRKIELIHFQMAQDGVGVAQQPTGDGLPEYSNPYTSFSHGPAARNSPGIYGGPNGHTPALMVDEGGSGGYVPSPPQPPSKDDEKHSASELAGQGVSISLDFVVIMGAGITFNMFSLNRGKSAGKMFFSFSISAKAGLEGGVSLSPYQIGSTLSNNNLDASQAEGYGIDFSGSYGLGSLSGGINLPRGETNALDFFQVPAFLGGGVGGMEGLGRLGGMGRVGAKVGASVGFGQTWLLNK